MIKTENLLLEVFDNTRDLVLVTDEKFNIRYISSNVEVIFGLKPFSLLGKNAFDFAPIEKREAWQLCLQDNWKSRSSEITLLNHNGQEIHFDVTVTNHVSHDAIRGMVVFLHDITKRKRAHHELVKTNNQLDQFIFKTIHDLQAPLHSAIGLASLAENSRADERSHYISMIKGSLEKLDQFIVELHGFLRNDKLEIRNDFIDLNRLIGEEIDSMRNLPDAKDMRIKLNLEQSVDLYSDILRVKTILTNIISNSIKYRDRNKEQLEIKINARISENEFTISIEDNGMGIDEKYLDKIFEMYFRVNTNLRGTGLGLYIVKDTIDRLNGKVAVESQPGKGTTFTVTLPNRVTSQPVLN